MANKYTLKFYSLTLMLLAAGFSSCFAQCALTFSYTGAGQTFTVPAGITTVTIDVFGASGGNSSTDASSGNIPGKGGEIQSVMTVLPGNVLNIYAGGQGSNYLSGAGGYNGGGNGGGYGSGYNLAGGGGGASDIRFGGTALTNRVIIAGGGGGDGNVTTASQVGGTGGGTTGGTGGGGCGTPSGGGGGGTSAAGGAAGSGSPAGTLGAAGSLGDGGAGGSYTGGCGGGGGGGYYGGGGGQGINGTSSCKGQGGGGSSYYNSTYFATPTVNSQGVNTGNGYVVISFSQPAIAGNGVLSTAITTTLTASVGGGTWSSVTLPVGTISTSGIVTGLTSGTSVISYTESGCPAATTAVTVNTPASALNFNGSSSYVNCGSYTLNSYTKEAWIYLTSYSGDNNIISGGITTSDDAFGASAGYLSGGHNGSWSVVADPAILSLNTWYHVALTYDAPSTTLKLYKNGILVNSSTSVPAISTPTGILLLGSYGAGNFFHGAIDEVRIWNSALSQAQIQSNMNCDVPGSTSGLTGYYRFNEGTASGANTGILTAYDYTGNGHCGTLTGFTLTGSTANYISGAVGSCNNINTPSPISGVNSVCPGATITLSNAATGGTWTSSNGNASVGSTTGIVTGISAGTANITFTLGCYQAYTTVTVNALPTITSISASPNPVCMGSLLSLSATGLSGTGTPTYNWSGPNSFSSTGTAPSFSATTTAAGGVYSLSVTYSGNGCTSNIARTPVVTVNAIPLSISGNTTLSSAITTKLADATTGGTWSSSSTATGTVSTSGVVTGISAGTTNISYTLSGCSATTTVTVNTPSNALRFNGSNNYVSCPAGVYFNGNFTIEAWVYPNGTSFPSWERIIDFGNGAGSNNVLLSISYATSGAPGFYVEGTQYQSSINLTPNAWNHVAATLNGTTATIYVNGVSGGTSTFSTPPANVTRNDCYIGKSNWGDPYANATLDEVRIWNVARTQAQIQANMNCDVAQQTGLIAYYRFDQGAAGGSNTGITSATDYSGNGNCGTLNNFSLTGSASNFVTGAIGDCNTIATSAGTTTGTTTLCTGGGTTILTNSVSGGTWSTSGSNVTLSGTSSASVTVTGVSAGTPNITYTLGCSQVITTVTVNTLPAITGLSASPSSLCTGSIINLTATGVSGTGSPVYSWTGPNSFSSASAAPTFTATTTAASGVYSLTVTYPGSGCTSAQATTAAVTVNSLPTISAGPSVAICHGNSTPLTATGGTAYSWTPAGTLSSSTGASIFATPIATTTYTVTGTSSGCSGTGFVTVSVNPLPASYSVTGGGSYCSGGSGVAIGLGNSDAGFNYQLQLSSVNTGSPVAGSGSAISFGNQTSAGTYTVVATNATSLCNANMTGVAGVVINSLPAAYSVTGGGSYCSGGSGVVVGLGNSDAVINYQLQLGGVNTGSPVAGTGSAISFGNQTLAGIYTVVASNAITLCNANMTGSAGVVINPLPAVYSVTGGGSYCSGGSGVAVGLGNSDAGFNYQLQLSGVNTGSPVAGSGSAISFGNQTSAGTYTVVSSNDITLCNANMTGSAGVVINSLPAVYSVTGGGNYCSGGSGVAVGLGNSDAGVNYQLQLGGLNTGSPVAGTGSAISFGNQTTAGTYTVVATNTTTLCNANMTGSTNVIVNSLPTISAGTGTAICYGSSTSLSATGGMSYSWTPGTGLSDTISATVTASPLITRTYTVTGINGSGCTNSAIVSVTVNPIPTVIAGSGVTVCFGYSAGLTGSGGATYTWAPASTLSVSTGAGVTAMPASTTTYTVTGTSLGCSSSATVTVTVNAPAISAGSGVAICNGNSVLLNSTGGTAYSWTPATGLSATTGASVTASPTVTTQYTVTGTLSGCTGTSSVTVTVNPVPSVSAISGAGGACIGYTTTLTDATPGGVWTSSSASVLVVGSTGFVNAVSFGTANISYTVTNIYSCSATVSVPFAVDGTAHYLYTCVGTGIASSSGDGGPAVLANLQGLRAIATDTAGNLYISDVTVNKIRKVGVNGIITTVAGNGTAGNTGDGGQATAASLNMTGGGGVCVDKAGNIIISNTNGQTLRKVNAVTGIITTICGTAGSSGYTGDGGPAGSALIFGPIGVCADTSGNIYFTDANNYRIRRIDAVTGHISTIIGTGSNAYSGDGGPGISARVSVPRDVTADKFGNLYIADYGNDVIRKYVIATGIITTVAGSGVAGGTGDAGQATAATLNAPARVLTDDANNLYIADQANNRIRKVNLTTGIISTAIFNGTAGYSGDGGPATTGQVSFPCGLAINKNGDLYVSDGNNHRIRVSPYNTGIYITLAGPTTVLSGTPVTFTANNPVNNNITYQWKVNGGTITGATNKTYTDASPASGNIYTCVLTVTVECGTGYSVTSNSITITLAGHRSNDDSSPPALSFTGAASLYPNPVHEIMTLTASELDNGAALIRIYDELGKVVVEKAITVANGQLMEQIEVKELPNAVYLIGVSDAGGKIVRIRFVKD